MKLMLLLIEICVVPARSLHYKKCFRYFRPNLSLIKTQENNTNIPTCKLSKCFRKSLSVSLRLYWWIGNISLLFLFFDESFRSREAKE
jgi:hypothetical protein